MLPPLLEAVDVLEAGYVASACALGASVIDAALRRTSKKKLVYKKVRATAIATELQMAIAEGWNEGRCRWASSRCLFQRSRDNHNAFQVFL